jgi:hypothetical protein
MHIKQYGSGILYDYMLAFPEQHWSIGTQYYW